MVHQPAGAASLRGGGWQPRPGPHAPVTMLDISRAVDASLVPARRARGQREWLRALARDPELAELRADRQASIRRAARVLARHADWKDRTSRPTRALLCKLAGIAVSTWKATRRWLESHGWLGTVRPGYVWAWRHNILNAGELPNDAAVYVLTVPRGRRDKPRPEPIVAGHSETRPLSPARSAGDLSPARDLPRTTIHDDGSPWFVVAFLRSQIAELRRGPGKTLTDRAVLAIARPFLAARWSPADLAYAIGHDPVTGRQHRTAMTGVRQPASWLAWRLTRWCADPGQAWKSWHARGRWDHDDWPVPAASPADRALAAAAADRTRLREVIPLTPGTGGGPSAEYRAIRAQLRRTGHA